MKFYSKHSASTGGASDEERKPRPYRKLSRKEQETVPYLPRHLPPAARARAESRAQARAVAARFPDREPKQQIPYRELAGAEKEKIPYLPDSLPSAARARAERQARERTAVPYRKLSAEEREAVPYAPQQEAAPSLPYRKLSGAEKEKIPYLPRHLPPAARERAETRLSGSPALPGPEEEDRPLIGPFLKTAAAAKAPAVAACFMAAFVGLTAVVVKGVDTGSGYLVKNDIEKKLDALDKDLLNLGGRLDSLKRFKGQLASKKQISPKDKIATEKAEEKLRVLEQEQKQKREEQRRLAFLKHAPAFIFTKEINKQIPASPSELLNKMKGEKIAVRAVSPALPPPPAPSP